jgi:hypothetical protein
VVTKDLLGGDVYAAPAKPSTVAPNVLQRISAAPALVTDGTFLPDGRVALRNYSAVYVYPRLGAEPSRIALPSQEQGESLTYTTDGEALLAGSEGAASPVWRIPLPTAQQTQRTERAREETEDGRRTAIYAGAVLIVAGCVAGLWIHVWRKGRRRRAGN